MTVKLTPRQVAWLDAEAHEVCARRARGEPSWVDGFDVRWITPGRSAVLRALVELARRRVGHPA